MTIRETQLPIRVYIEDTDAGGIVYYVNYLKYIERVRTEFMRELGFHKGAIFSDSLMFVVTAVTAKYIAPARLDEQLIATAAVISTGRVQLDFAQQVLRGDQLLFEATVKVAAVDPETLKPKRLPSVLLDALQ